MAGTEKIIIRHGDVFGEAVEVGATIDVKVKGLELMPPADYYQLATEYGYEVISDSSSRDKVSAFGFILQHSEWDYVFQSTVESSDWSWNKIPLLFFQSDHLTTISTGGILAI